MTRKILIFGFAASIVGLSLACSNSDEGSSSGGTGNGTGNGSGNGNGNSTFKTCSDTTGTSCTEAEMKPYSDCLMDKCDTSYKKCYGDGYKSGSFSGPCGTFITCLQKCDCTDTQCILACKPDEACSTCSEEMQTCAGSCTEPECSKIGNDAGDTANATCADLQACCDSVADPDQKEGCQQAKDAANDDDAACSSYYSAFKTAGLCTN